MKKITLSILLSLFIIAGHTHAQIKDSLIKGYVSYTSSKHTYIKFESTKAINIGDTLYQNLAEGLTAVLIVTNKSSTSCVCISLGNVKLSITTEIFYKNLNQKEKKPAKDEPPVTDNVFKNQAIKPDTNTIKKTIIKKPVNEWKGRLSIASYSSISNNTNKPSHRLNYTLSLNGNQIGESKFSFDSYISFRHKIDEWYKVKENINNALKIYALAVKYSFAGNMDVYFGRKINFNLSSMGAIDGIQIEKKYRKFVFGAVAGSRPDWGDYSLNMKLFEMGGFVGYNFDIGNKMSSQNTIAFVEQQNHGNTDRRFLHFQHTSTLFRDVNVFGSMEIDLFEKINEVKSNTMRLTNLYLTMRYRISRKLSISASYDSRSDILYYETYKNRIDSLLEYETRQGLRLQFNYQPFRFVSIGCSGNIRFQKDNQNDSKNINAYLSYTKVPLLNCSVNLTSNYLMTNYLTSNSYGINISRDIFKAKVYGDIYYRKVDYQYTNIESSFGEQIVGINLSYRLNNKISFNVYCEESFEQTSRYLRVNLRAMLRF